MTTLRTTGFIFSIGLAVRLIWWSAVWFLDGTLTSTDSGTYLRLADNLLSEGIFSLSQEPPLIPDMIRTPGYPIWLIPFRLTAASFVSIALVQSILGAMLPVMVYDCAKKLGASFPLTAALITVFDLCLVLFTPLILSDGLFVWVLTAIIWMFIRHQNQIHWWFGVCVGLGMLILVRPVAIFLPVLFLFYIFLYGSRQRRMLVYLIIGLLPVFGWLYRNYVTFDVVALSSIGSNNLLLFNAAAVQAEAEDLTFNDVQHGWIEKAQQKFRKEKNAAGSYMKWSRDEALSVIADHPTVFLRQSARKLILYPFKPPRSWIDRSFGFDYTYEPLTGTDAKDNHIRRFFAENQAATILFSLGQLLLSVLTFILAVMGSFRLYRKSKSICVALCAMVLYFWLTSIFTLPDARFRMPVVPVLAVLASFGVSTVSLRLTRK